jgi:hypothetical protein
MALKFSSVGGGGVQSGTTEQRPASPSVGDQYYNGTLGRLEIYTGATTGWKAIGGEVRTPSVSAVADVGTSRAFNNGAIDVTVIPNSDGGLPTSYTVTSTPGSIVASGASPVRVTGLNSNTSYTFTATASNDYGSTSSVSSTSSSAISTTVPQAPTISTPTVVAGTAFGGSPSLDVPFSANATGGKAINSYTVTSSPGSFTASGASSPLRVSGLTGGTSYTFTVTATNDNGTSLPSTASSTFAAATAPGIATLGTAEIAASNKVRIPYTIDNGGSAITSWSAQESPAIAGGSRTVTFDASYVYVERSDWAQNQSYSFTITATNAAGTGQASASSNGVVVVRAYALSQTYTSSTTYTVPSGTGTIAVYAFSGSQTGQSGQGMTGGIGGAGARGIAFSEYSVTPGQNYTVTIGGANGTTNFGNLASVSPNTGNSNVGGSVQAAGGVGGQPNNNPSSAGGSGQAGTNLTLNQPGLTTYTTGGGGGAGGVGGAHNAGIGNNLGQRRYGFSNAQPGSGGTQFTLGGGGGYGQWMGNYYGGYAINAGGSGQTGQFNNTGGNGGGGGGGYGTAQGSTQGNYYNYNAVAGSGGAGANGKVIIFEK